MWTERCVNYNDYVLHYVPSMYTTLIDCTCTFLRCYIPTLLVCYLRCLYVALLLCVHMCTGEHTCKRSLNEKFKQRQKRDFDRHHGVREQSVIPEDTPVWITSGENPVPGQIVSQAVNPRFYIVGTQYGQLCRNQQHINVNRSAEATTKSTMTRNTPGESRSPIMTRLRTGTAIRPPNRLY